MGSRAGSSEVSTTRTSKTGWLKDSDHAVVAKLTARIAGVTGLNTDLLSSYSDRYGWGDNNRNRYKQNYNSR